MSSFRQVPDALQAPCCNTPSDQVPLSVYNSGQTVVVATGDYRNNGGMGIDTGKAIFVSVLYSVGTIHGSSISWGAVMAADTISDTCYSSTPQCHFVMGIRYLSVTAAPDGNLAFSYNWFENRYDASCTSSNYSVSAVYVKYKGARFLLDRNAGCGSYDQSDLDRSVILASSPLGRIEVLYQFHSGSGVQLRARWIDSGTSTLSVDASADTFINDCCNHAGGYTPYGSYRFLELAAPSNESDVLVKFSLPTLPGGAALSYASLRFYVSRIGLGTSDTYVLESVNPWVETTTWNDFFNQASPILYNPSVSANSSIPLSQYSAGSYLTLDATNPVRGYYEGRWADNGLLITMPTSATAASIIFSSNREAGNHPRLTLGYVCCIGPVEVVNGGVADGDQFSAVIDKDFGVHVVYRMPDGTVSHFYRSSSGAWSGTRDILSGQANNPTITVDLSNNDVYVFAIEGTAIAMRSKPLALQWSDRSILFPVAGRTFPMTDLGSNFASWASSPSSRISLIWTETDCAPYCNYFVMFASIPIPSAWSPFAAPTDPWDGNGIAPFGQYFANLGESVSPATGMLTVRQTDLKVAGRGLDLEITRVYTEPQDFYGDPTGGAPYDYQGVYGFRDETFTNGWYAAGTGGTFTVWREGTNGDVLNITGTPGSPGDDYRYWARDGLAVNTTLFPYFVARWLTSYSMGARIVLRFSDGTAQTQPNDSSGISVGWVTKTYTVTPGKIVNRIELYADDYPDYIQTGQYSVFYDYVGFTKGSLGNGWQLNFPWMNSFEASSYIHLWDGQGYRIPSSFWTGASATMENHQGEHFRMVRSTDGTITLYTKSGVSYIFDANHRLMKIVDATGMNTIVFAYDSSGRISTITDTLGRVFQFNYDPNLPMLIRSINQLGTSRTITYAYDYKLSLTSVTDPAGRVTSYGYSSTSAFGPKPWLLSRITYPTQWYTNYTYTQVPLGTEPFIFTYRIALQCVSSGPQCGTSAPSLTISQHKFSYTQDAGDRIATATVIGYNGTTLANYVDFAFSFAGMTMNVSDASHKLVRGVQQLFGVEGEIVKEVFLITDGATRLGSYTNYYRYDLWGNRIYSRLAINPAANWYHETFSDYYNNGLPVGFYSFAETVSQTNHAQTDNNWNITSGQWTVVNGEYMLTGEKGDQSLIEVPQGDAAFQMTVRWLAGQYFEGYMGFRYQTNGNHYEVYLSAYDNTLRFVKVTGGTYTRLQAVTVTPSKNVHYAIRVESSGYAHTVYLNETLEFQVTDQDVTMLTGRYLALGTYSSTSPTSAEQIGFSNIYVQPLPSTFSNGFFSTSPNSTIHGVVAGIAQLQNGTGTLPVETYFSYNSWGEPVQNKQRYDSSPGVLQWLTMGWSYDSFGNPSTSSDARGYTTYYSYSAKYGSAFLTNETQVVSSGKVTHLYGYDNSTGTMVWARDPNLNNVIYKYDILNRPVNVTYPNRDFTAYSYNDLANYVNITNENSWKTRKTYDGLGRLSITDRFLGKISYSTETYTYNWQDKETSSRDPLGNLYTYTYDPLGRLTLTSKPDGNTTRIAYDDLDSWVVRTDESGNSRCVKSDILGRLTSVIEYSDSSCTPRLLSNSTYVTNYYYDEIGNLARVSNSIGKSTGYVRDNLNRLTKTTYADGSFESYSYDNNGNVLLKTDRKAAQTSYSYDSLNRVTSITYASMGQDTYSYDSNSNLSQLNTQNTTLTYAYDSRNRVTSESYSVNPTLGGSVAYGTLITLANRTNVPVQNLRVGISLLSYDTAANSYVVSTITQLSVVHTSNMLVIRTQDPMPLRVDNATAQRLYVKTSTGLTGWLSVTMLRTGDYLYNALDQRWTMVTSIELAPSGIHIMYDIYTTAPGNYIANGYLDPHKNGPTSPSSGAVSNSYRISYTYSGEVLSTITYPDGFVATYSYDPLGRVLNVTKSGTTTYYARFTYYKNDELRGVQYGNALLANYTYNKLGLVARETLNNTSTSPPTPLLILNYQYNKTATVASVVGNSTNLNGNLFTLKEQYRYDPLQRLNNSYLKSVATVNTISYAHNNLGNRISQKVNGVPSSYVYNATNNELTTILGGWSYSYDGNGNLRAKTQGTTTWAYTWDSANRLVKVSSNNVLQGAYAYDGIGRLVESVESSTTFYAYYVTETLSELISGGATTDYLYAGGLRIGRLSGATVNYYHTDALGSTRLVTSATKTIQFSDNYQAFGEDNGTPYCSGSCEKYKFTGKPYSIATGLYYYFERWYDQSIGRFVNQDPLPGYASDPQSLNPYVYVENVPTSLVDPTGAFDEFSSNRDKIGIVSLPDEPFIPTADFFNNIETQYLVESENPALARIAPTAGAQTTLDQFTTEPNLARGYGSEERLSNLRTGIANHNAYMDAAVQQYSDLEPNTGPGQERILGASGHTRIPDFRDLAELKTGRVIQNTGNLKDFITYAEQIGGQVRLFVRPGVDLAPIQIAIDRNLVAVYYVKPILVLPAQ